MDNQTNQTKLDLLWFGIVHFSQTNQNPPSTFPMSPLTRPVLESTRQVLSFNQPTWGKEPNDEYQHIVADADGFPVAVEHKPSYNVEAGEDGGGTATTRFAWACNENCCRNLPLAYGDRCLCSLDVR